jgi:hypothetical protein
MIWKLSETIIKNYHELKLDAEAMKGMWDMLFSTVKEACYDFQEESRFAGIHILTQLIQSGYETNSVSQEKY